MPKKIIALLILLTLALPAAALDTDPGAAATVDTLHETLLQAMQGSGGYAERLALIGPVVEHSFDFTTVARLVLGKHWRRLDDVQRADFLSLFKKSNSNSLFSIFLSNIKVIQDVLWQHAD